MSKETPGEENIGTCLIDYKQRDLMVFYVFNQADGCFIEFSNFFIIIFENQFISLSHFHIFLL